MTIILFFAKIKLKEKPRENEGIMREIFGTLGVIAHMPYVFSGDDSHGGDKGRFFLRGAIPVRRPGRSSIDLFWGRRQWAQAPSNPPTPGSGEWRGRETMSKTEPKRGDLLKSLKKEIRRGGAAVSYLSLGAPRGAPWSVQKQVRRRSVQGSVES